MTPNFKRGRLVVWLRWAALLLALLLGSALITTAVLLRSAPTTAPQPVAVNPPPIAPADTGAVVQAQMRTVSYHVEEGIVLQIGYLRGHLVPSVKGGMPVFDDPSSFAIQIGSADIAVDTLSLSRLINRHVFGYPGAPIRGLHIGVEKDQLRQSGKLGAVSFTILADVSVTPDGQIRLHPAGVKVLGLNVKGLMRRFGLTLQELLKVRPDRGLHIEKDDLLLDPTVFLPPPRIEGQITAVRLEPGDLVLQFGRNDSLPRRSYYGGSKPVPNYMHFAGAGLRFGRLTMVPADLLIVDRDPSDPFDFSLARYHDQLVAGTHRTTPEDGLVAELPDLHRLADSVSGTP